MKKLRIRFGSECIGGKMEEKIESGIFSARNYLSSNGIKLSKNV